MSGGHRGNDFYLCGEGPHRVSSCCRCHNLRVIDHDVGAQLEYLPRAGFPDTFEQRPHDGPIVQESSDGRHTLLRNHPLDRAREFLFLIRGGGIKRQV